MFAQGNTVSIWLSGVFTLSSLVVFLLSLKFGMGGWEKKDIICLLIAITGIIFWKLTQNPIYALFFSLGADLAGQAPMLIKTFRYPKTEVWTFYTIGIVASVLNILAIQKFTIQEFAFPVYIILVNALTILLILRNNIFLKKKKNAK